ncbi:MAG: hypothetical protein JXR58_13090 [Bacteroidales bacterium]|nr:hypothetical protein [Bacteroidales bacterium]
MNKNLVIGLLGKSGSGKSYLWSKLFGREVKTGKRLRKLFLTENEYIEVFLVNVAAAKRKKFIGEIVTIEKPEIILCSMDYSPGVLKTIDYFSKNEYSMTVFWLNPGYNEDYDPELFYTLGVINLLIEKNAVIARRNGKKDPGFLILEIKKYLYGWAKFNGLIKTTIK